MFPFLTARYGRCEKMTNMTKEIGHFFTKAGALADQLELATRRGTLSARPLEQSVAEDWLQEALAVCTDIRAHSFCQTIRRDLSSFSLIRS